MNPARNFATLAIAAGILSAVVGCSQPDSSSPGVGDTSAAQGPTATVSTVLVATGTVAETLETFGTVEFDPHATRTVSFANAGQVIQLFVSPGQALARNDSLLVLGSLPSTSMEVERARIELEYAGQNLARIQRLRAKHLATNEAEQQAEKDLATARATLVGLGVGESSQGGRVIASPFAGVVVDVLVTAGDVVHSGQGAVLLAPATGLTVRAGFEPEDAVSLAEGMSIVVAPVFRADGEASVEAVLARIHRVVDPTTQLVETLIRPAEVSAWMVAGTRVKVSSVVRSANNAVRIPREAIVSANGETGVYAVENGVARWRPLHLGIENDHWVEVRSGLKTGATVVTTGRTSISDGMSVVSDSKRGD